MPSVTLYRPDGTTKMYSDVSSIDVDGTVINLTTKAEVGRPPDRIRSTLPFFITESDVAEA